MFLTVQSFLRPTQSNIISRISTAADGAEGNSDSYDAVMSADGRYVLFSSSARNLVDGDSNGHTDIFRKDLVTGTITRVSTTSTGAEAIGGDSYGAQFSPDGRYVLFESEASNLVEGDSNNRSDIFLKDLASGKVTRVSTTSTGEPDGGSFGAQFSPDGRFVVFASFASNLVEGDSGGWQDVFVKELFSGKITCISTRGEEAANGHSATAQFSTDGRYVLFNSTASNLVEGDSNNVADIFIKELASGTITRVSITSAGEANGDSGGAQFSRDGRYVLFRSEASNLVEGDSNGVADIFIKELASGKVTRASTTSTGAEATGGGSGYAQFSPDGRYVLFESYATNLVPGDTNKDADIFLKDLITGAITCVSNTADGRPGSDYSVNPQFSPDGRYALFSSLSGNLVTGSSGDSENIFRVDLLYKANTAAIAEGRFVEARLGVGSASSATIAWGDGTSTTAAPVNGSVSVHHAYASTGVKAATVSLVEGALTWVVPHTINLGAGTMARNTALTDTLSGGAGSDILTGDAFANHLIANGGNDRLNGGDGNDRLVGGTGKGTFTGGKGRDVFAFDDRETASSKSKADYITDFSKKAGDKIDLRLVDANTRKRGDQNFSFIGKEDFTKAGQVRYEKTKKDTYVYLNTDSDKAAEAVIKLKGAFDLTKGWFVL